MGGFASCMPDEEDVAAAQQHQQQRMQQRRQQQQQHGEDRERHVAVEPGQRAALSRRASARERPAVVAFSSPVVPSRRERLRGHESFTPAPLEIDPHASARVCVEATPSCKEQRALFKFSCPICFMYFKEIYKSACCSNYVCVPCALAHVTQRLALPGPLQHMPVGAVQDVCCPSCNSEHVSFLRVHQNSTARSYAESPATRALLEQAARRQQQQQHPPPAVTPDGGEAPVRQSSFVQLRQRVLDFDDAALAEEEEEAAAAENADAATAPFVLREQHPEQRMAGSAPSQMRQAATGTAAAGAGLPPRAPPQSSPTRPALRDVSNSAAPNSSTSQTSSKQLNGQCSGPRSQASAVPAAVETRAPLPTIAPFVPDSAPLPAAVIPAYADNGAGLHELAPTTPAGQLEEPIHLLPLQNLPLVIA